MAAWPPGQLHLKSNRQRGGNALSSGHQGLETFNPGSWATVELDDKICYCFHISKRKVLNYIRIHQPRVPSQISDCGGAGTGCGWCVPFLKRYFMEMRGNATDGGQADEPDQAAYAQQRGQYLLEGGGTPPPGAEPPPPPEEG